MATLLQKICYIIAKTDTQDHSSEISNDFDKTTETKKLGWNQLKTKTMFDASKYTDINTSHEINIVHREMSTNGYSK